ncbi:protein phyllopod [Anastrepha obliqua]|uniref:protein phyllopod n=1 Tax=Anastrepha obliqua TaxID=95512 RepID=UPI002409B8B4|nr:protein phyllopod [Anastrepha obliqua]XP_054739561.1 protein phyllopod [Anastrepha obliqua]
MSEKSSEYLKRTCLICGCHTNQTINIYEPRSGPNIVELIQAKFKFQPLNEDKYLCFSCNNWLINWHSLQALNSNDAESPSGTFRPQMNSVLHKEKPENQRQQTHSSQFYWQTSAQLCRPTAKIRPWSIIGKTSNQIGTEKFILPKHFPLPVQNLFVRKSKRILKYQRKFRSRKLYYGRRKLLLKNLRLRRKFIQYKGTSNSYIFDKCDQSNKTPDSTSPHFSSILKCKKDKKYFTSNSKKCSYLKNEYKEKAKQKQEYWQTDVRVSQKKSIESNNNVINDLSTPANVDNKNKQLLGRPLVDGKVVSMLRRLGTTLSHENFNESTNTSKILFPRIMSPTKSKPQWTRQLDEDEILLGFDSAISEVLPQIIQGQQQNIHDDKCMPEIMAVMQAKRKLTYQVSICKDCSQCVNPLLPEGLSISLV